MSSSITTDSYGLEVGAPAIKSVGPIVFGPDGILFVADNVEATIFAIDLGDAEVATASGPLDIDSLDTRLAAYLGCGRDEIFIRDMAVHPTSQRVYLSVMRGSGAAALPLLIEIGPDGALSEVPLTNVRFSQTKIEDAPERSDTRTEARVAGDDREGAVIDLPNGARLRVARDPLRTVTVTDMNYIDGVLLVAGATNEEFSSSLRRIAFPFSEETTTSSLEIFHVSHGRYETASPIRTFVPYSGNTSILASYTCTPIVRFTLSDLRPGSQIKGRTVADLGAMNTPVDMVSYSRDGEEYLLVSNTKHPLLKIACSDIEQQEPLTEPKQPLGVPRQALPQQGVGRMANLNGSYVLMMQQDGAGNVNLNSYSTASL